MLINTIVGNYIIKRHKHDLYSVTDIHIFSFFFAFIKVYSAVHARQLALNFGVYVRSQTFKMATFTTSH